ncbi:MAG: division/cell wall cluster transcriptional repressor MraZ [Duodenibacillus sp.]|nr:division/cell wall cluster transcriptional repressor MraZ [Duodenibacillus sp.]
MFQGTSLLALDAKGRMTMPTRHRDVFASYQSAGGPLEVTLTRHPEGCLLIYPRSVWEAKRAELIKQPYSFRMLQRIVVGSAIDLTIDAAGRLLIPSDLRALCRLDKDVVLLGLGEHFELWDAAQLKAQEEAAMQQGLADQAFNFNF